VTAICLVHRGSSVTDPEGAAGPGWVAGVVAEGGGQVDLPRPAENPDGEVTQADHGAGAGAGPDLGAVLGEGDVADVMQRLDCPVPMDQVGKAGGAGLAWVRLVTAETVTVRHRRDMAAARRSRVLRVTWMTWAACGNPKWRTKTALRVRSSIRPWPRSQVRSSTGTRCQGRPAQRSSRVGWWP
jgi:hypothetical protein